MYQFLCFMGKCVCVPACLMLFCFSLVPPWLMIRTYELNISIHIWRSRKLAKNICMGYVTPKFPPFARFHEIQFRSTWHCDSNQLQENCLFCIFVSSSRVQMALVEATLYSLPKKFNLLLSHRWVVWSKALQTSDSNKKGDCINPFNLILVMEWQTNQRRWKTHFQPMNGKSKWRKREKKRN